MLTTVEDLIIYICRNGKVYTDNLNPKDKAVFFSISSQLERKVALTAGQSNLMLRLLENNKTSFLNIEGYTELLDSPKFKYSFRVVDTSKIIRVFQSNNQQFIGINFPYDKKMLKTITNLELGKVPYNKEKKLYEYPLNEKTVFAILDNEEVQQYGFSIDQNLIDLYKKIKNIAESREEYIPLLDYDNGLILRNTNKITSNYFNENRKNNLFSDIFLAKTMGISPSKRLIEKIKSMNLEPDVMDFLLKTKKNLVISKNNADSLSRVFKHIVLIDQWPIVVILPDFESVDKTLEQWHRGLLDWGIKNTDISVLFRSQKNKIFNEYIASNQLNNFVSESTKIVFIKHKIPKILYNINFKPKIVITTSKYHAHYSTQKLVDSHPCMLYYTDQISEVSDA
jgi:hypothetical protein